MITNKTLTGLAKLSEVEQEARIGAEKIQQMIKNKNDKNKKYNDSLKNIAQISYMIINGFHVKPHVDILLSCNHSIKEFNLNTIFKLGDKISCVICLNFDAKKEFNQKLADACTGNTVDVNSLTILLKEISMAGFKTIQLETSCEFRHTWECSEYPHAHNQYLEIIE